MAQPTARKIQELAGRVEELAKDKDKYLTSPNDFEAAAGAAVFALSKWKPLRRIKEYVGDGITYNLDAPTYWVEGFSRVIEIRTPWVELSQAPAAPLAESRYLVYLSADGVEKIKLLDTIPATGQTTRVVYTAPHVVSTTASTITSVEDEERVIALATSTCLRQMAAIALANANASFSADSKEHSARASMFTTLADFYEKRSGLETGLAVSVSVLPRVDTDGNNRLTHR